MKKSDVSLGTVKKRFMQSLAILSLATATVGTGVNAEEYDKRFYIAPMIGYVVADSDRKADDGGLIGVGVGKPFSKYINLELDANYAVMQSEVGSTEFAQSNAGVNGLLFFTRRGLAPYLLGGVSALNTDFNDTDSTSAAINLGLGIMPVLARNGLALRGEIRYRADLNDEVIPTQDGFDDVIVGLGLAIPLGSRTVAPAPVPVAVAPKIEKPADSDNDGVIDRLDACPNSPAGAKVDARGCEVDSDGDGVVDSRDRCPNTSKGAKVDTSGCLVAQTIVLKGVTFASNSATLVGGSYSVLDEAAQTLVSNPKLRVEVAGHTDDRGAAAYNQSLSQKRAEAVRKYLVGKGANANNLTAKGYGEAYPATSNATKQGRAENRRVELRILK